MAESEQAAEKVFCVNCIAHKEDHSSALGSRHQCRKCPDLVTGEPGDCMVARFHGGDCGIEGKLYEAKEPQPVSA